MSTANIPRRDPLPRRQPSASSHRFSMPRRSNFPDWVLLDMVGHISSGGGEENATIAWSEMSDDVPIEVYFVVADPPAHPVHPSTSYVVFPSCLALDRCRFTNLFIYKLGLGTPSLELLQHPYRVNYLSNNLVVLSCGDHCLLVESRWQFHADLHQLHVFSSKTKS
uniref:Uncharacterized protein n=1 Tax=Leersia perrieri TaxID=77586 RepID=A0A0D9W4D0_9ORYZ